jgi:hypothetical protein
MPPIIAEKKEIELIKILESIIKRQRAIPEVIKTPRILLIRKYSPNINCTPLKING